MVAKVMPTTTGSLKVGSQLAKEADYRERR